MYIYLYFTIFLIFLLPLSTFSFRVPKSRMLQGSLSQFRIWSHRTDLGDKRPFPRLKLKLWRLWTDLGVSYLKCSCWNIKGGYLSHILGFEVIDRVYFFNISYYLKIGSQIKSHIQLLIRSKPRIRKCGKVTPLYILLWAFWGIEQPNRFIKGKDTFSAFIFNCEHGMKYICQSYNFSLGNELCLLNPFNDLKS